MYLGALGQNDLNCQLCHLKGYFIVLHEQITEELIRALVSREKSQNAFWKVMRHFIIFIACTKPNITLCYSNFYHTL